MFYILGAAMMIAAVAFLHAGRLVVQRIGASGSRREALVLDTFALGFTALFAIGLMLLARDLTGGIAPVFAFLAALTAAVIGSRLVATAFRRAAERPLAGRPPVGGAPAA